jgi:lipoate-protein ligase A
VKLLDLTLPTPEENLALDEALLDAAEAAGEPTEVLRLWEPAAPLVVIGRSSKIAAEVNVDYCQSHGIPVLRRSSGGAAIVTGPGCLMYAVVLSFQRRPQLHSIDQAHQFVLERLLQGLRKLAPDAVRRGTSDLAIGERKFSGNSLRCKRTHLLYHGTLLYHFPLELISACLRTAPRQPAYRAGRDHDLFVTNLPVTKPGLVDALARAWEGNAQGREWPQSEVERLVRERYSAPRWHEQF